MMLATLITAGTAKAVLAASALAVAQAQTTPVVKTGYAPVNDLKLYYEIHGSGEPLVLLHGGLGSIEMMANLLPELAKNHEVIAVDLQAHGRTADIDRPITYEALGDDIAALLEYLGVKRADLVGYSLGGGAALQTTFRHPAVVRKLVVISTPFKHDGWYPGVRALMAQMGPASAEQMKPSPIYQTYARIAPRPQDWTRLVTKLGKLVSAAYDWSEPVAAIKAPTLLVFGDADSVPVSHAAQFFELLGGSKQDGGWDGSGISNSRLAILPATTHYNMAASPVLPGVVLAFLDAPMPATK